MGRNHSLAARSGPRQRGYSLVGIMIAMALGLFVLTGMFQLFVTNKASFRLQIDQSQLHERGRFVIDQLTQDLKRAGYYGGNAEVSMISGSLPQIEVEETCEANSNRWGRMLRQALYGIDGSAGSARLAAYACLPDFINTDSDVIVTRYASPWQVTRYERSRPYLRTALFEGRMFLGSDEADAANRLADPVQSTRELVAHAYFIGETPEECEGNDVPGLFQIALDENGQPQARLFAPGVERLRFQYGLDLDGDGNVDRYTRAADVADWARVVSVELWLLVRSQCPDPLHTDDRTYVLGSETFQPQDHYRRQFFVSTISLRNRS